MNLRYTNKQGQYLAFIYYYMKINGSIGSGYAKVFPGDRAFSPPDGRNA
jgi:hypothetical protein